MLRVLLALTFSYPLDAQAGVGGGSIPRRSARLRVGRVRAALGGWPMANSAALLPAVLYALVPAAEASGQGRISLLLTLAFFALLLGGHPETILYSLGLSLFCLEEGRSSPWSSPLLSPPPPCSPSWTTSRRPCGPRGSPKPHLGGSLGQHWLQIAAPNAYGNSRYVEYWGLTNTNEDAGGFVGTLTLLAALLALGARKRFPQERLFLAVAILSLVLLSPWGLGTRRLMLPLAFSLSYLGACTLERVRLGELRRWQIILAAAGLAAVIAWGYLGQGDAGDDRLAPLRTGWLHWQGRFLVLGTLFLIFGRGKRWTAPAAAALIAAELLLAHLPANPPMPQRLANVVNGPIRFLQNNLQGNRMAALGRDFPPNLALLYGLSDARVYNPMAPAEYLRHLEPILVGWWGEMPELGNPGHPLYRELGVRYLLTAPGVQLPLRPVFQDQDGWIYEIADPRPRRTDVIYRPRAFLLGCLLSALGLAAGAAWWITAPVVPTRSAKPG